MAKLISIGDEVKERLDELREAGGGISYNEALLSLMEKPNLVQVWNSHMLALVTLMKTYGHKGEDGDPQPELDAALEHGKAFSTAFKKAIGALL